MHRFTAVSITMLAGLVAAPACGAIIGIDDDRILDPDAGIDGSVTGDGNAAPGDATAGGDDASAKCDPFRCGFFVGLSGGGCNAQNQCERRCTGSGCPDDNRCPDGLDCVLKCEGAACHDLRCYGGASCTIDCTGGDCNKVRCESPTCTFLCGNAAKSCEDISCQGANATCKHVCSNPGGSTDCRSPVDCCRSVDADDDDDSSPQRVCPPSSRCGG